MVDSVGWGEILVLVVAGLFILGPERLPGAAAWVGRTIRQVRQYATGAREQLRNELGPEFDELRKPLEELRGLRNFNPRIAATQALIGRVAKCAAGPPFTTGLSIGWRPSLSRMRASWTLIATRSRQSSVRPPA